MATETQWDDNADPKPQREMPSAQPELDQFKQLKDYLSRLHFPDTRATLEQLRLELEQRRRENSKMTRSKDTANPLNDPVLHQELKSLGLDPDPDFIQFVNKNHDSYTLTYRLGDDVFPGSSPGSLTFRVFVGNQDKNGDWQLLEAPNGKYRIAMINMMAAINAPGQAGDIYFEKHYVIEKGPLPTKAVMLQDLRQLMQSHNEKMEKAVRIIQANTFELMTRAQRINRR